MTYDSPGSYGKSEAKASPLQGADEDDQQYSTTVDGIDGVPTSVFKSHDAAKRGGW